MAWTTFSLSFLYVQLANNMATICRHRSLITSTNEFYECALYLCGCVCVSVGSVMLIIAISVWVSIYESFHSSFCSSVRLSACTPKNALKKKHLFNFDSVRMYVFVCAIFCNYTLKNIWNVQNNSFFCLKQFKSNTSSIGNNNKNTTPEQEDDEQQRKHRHLQIHIPTLTHINTHTSKQIQLRTHKRTVKKLLNIFLFCCFVCLFFVLEIFFHAKMKV